MLKGLLPTWSPPAALRGLRAMIVVAGLFAIGEKVIENPQTATFAAFGGFATLVLSSFAGTRRDKLMAHLLLALGGSVLIVIGTAVSSTTAIAVIVTVPVTFTVFFLGVTGPNAASGATGALLAYVLPAASPGTMAMIPDRLAGWWMASVAGTLAVLLLSPPAAGQALKAAAARVARALSLELVAALAGLSSEERLAACIELKHELLASFNSTPYRPVGLAVADQALANAVELLEWCTSLVVDAIREQGNLADAEGAERKLIEEAALVLEASGGVLHGEDVRPDLEGLNDCLLSSRRRLEEEGASAARSSAQIAFHAHAIAVAALAIGADAMVAVRRQRPEEFESERWRWYLGGVAARRAQSRLGALAVATRRHASVRSVWFVNSARAALALAAAVAVADLSTVQHGFWVVLGTLSVLRTNAAATGSTALRALSGTVLGFVIGGALLVVIGSSTTALWAALPVAVFLAGYAPGTAPFAIGQAAFTVTVAILFNLLIPVGWKVGVVRLEDVAIGCAVSVVVGALFWPRGVSAVVGDDLADAYRAGAAYLSEAIEWACGTRSAEPEGAPASIVAAARLDEALRGFLAEQGTKHVEKGDLWRLVGGAMRLRLTARAIAALPRDATSDERDGEALGLRGEALTSWYAELARLVGKPHGEAVASLAPVRLGPETIVHDDSPSAYAVWLCEHLDHLAEHLGELIGPSTQIAQLRRRPWWL